MDDISVQVENISKTFKIMKPHGISSLLKRSNPKKYGSFLALDDVSFTVKKGEALGILGLNYKVPYFHWGGSFYYKTEQLLLQIGASHTISVNGIGERSFSESYNNGDQAIHPEVQVQLYF